VRLTTSPPSRAECHENWGVLTPRTLWATPGLLWDSFTFYYGGTQRRTNRNKFRAVCSDQLTFMLQDSYRARCFVFCRDEDILNIPKPDTIMVQ
jgi:hypothetical protein